MDRNGIPRISGHVAARIIGGEVFVMHLDAMRTYALNETASFVWSLIDGARTVGEIAGALLDEYDVSDGESWSALTEMLGVLVSEGLVTLAGPDA